MRKRQPVEVLVSKNPTLLGFFPLVSDYSGAARRAARKEESCKASRAVRL